MAPLRVLLLSSLAACAWWTGPPAEPEPPPAETLCANTPRDGCWVELPPATVTLGAQAHDPAATGFDEAASAAEGPVRTASFGRLWMSRNEAPTGAWNACVRREVCDDAQVDRESPLSTIARSDAPTLPLNAVTWEGANQLCRFLGGRLPTEDEWERAARGTEARRWPWGDEPGCGVRDPSLPPQPSREGAPPSARDEMLRGDCLLDGPAPHNATLGSTPEGLVAMAGSLWEWTATPGDAPGERRVRGGGWLDAAAEDLRTTVRGSLPEDEHLPDVGVRCVWGTP